ncbi:MAG: gephyrin-like molybdotransferase Glp [Hyphomicrobiales bacterium]
MLLPVHEALTRVLEDAPKTQTIHVPLHEADGYTLATNVAATRTQPPFAASAMDGYAVRHADLVLGKSLEVIGEAAAGHRFFGTFQAGSAVRIFTGAPLPDGADTILIQEDAERDGDTIIPREIPKCGLYVRPAGMDFAENEELISAGTILNFQSISIAAAMNHPTLPVHKKPIIGIMSNGDELVLPGEVPNDDQIIASNAFGVASLVRAAGGEVIDLGIARDTTSDIVNAFDRAQSAKCDVLVTLGGASVGDHDLIKPALAKKGVTLDFWKIAMRPGKPFMFGKLDNMRMLGMPGNPVSSLVCSLLFLRPLLLTMQGRDPAYDLDTALVGTPIPKNSQRPAYLRAFAAKVGGKWVVDTFAQQDSSILSVLAKSNCLVLRDSFEEPAKTGDRCTIMWI